MKILLLGSGGREHALALALKKSKEVTKIYALPGNAGTAKICENVEIDINNNKEIVNFAKERQIDFVIIGPEGPLVNGLSDDLAKAKILAFGPSKDAAKLEGSKDFTKHICIKNKIPTAKYASFTNELEAKKYIDDNNLPIVIKADGLALGKGVIIAQTKEEAYIAIDQILVQKQFGSASDKIVIEEFLIGEEISYFVLCDGRNILPLGSAQDHKTVGEKDTGLNTGGMGTYAPNPLMTKELENQVINEIIKPLVKGMEEQNCSYRGVIFAGLMLTKDGPKLLEINARFGDPETQVLLPLLPY